MSSITRVHAAAALAIAVLAVPDPARAQSLDLCGCAAGPTLGVFDPNQPIPLPSGFTQTGASAFALALPSDGVAVLDSFTLERTAQGFGGLTLTIVGAPSNRPATLLVRGDVFIGNSDAIVVAGSAGGAGSAQRGGAGGNPGPGGFAGGDGAYQLGNLSSDGGAGIGAGGGAPGLASGVLPTPGAFFGAPELRPLNGGSGGGGGWSASNASGCAGGGGGGGGGALLIVANGTVTVTGTINAAGGNGGAAGNATCASGGSGGSGGAIRILANRVTGAGPLNAAGGNGGSGAPAGQPGRVRLEALTDTYTGTATPVALRTGTPGPIVDSIAPDVAITAIDGANVPADPQGYRGAVDVIVPAPGLVRVDLRTRDVPTGTDVEVSVKPEVGGAAVSQRVTLVPASCIAGTCLADVSFDLASGAYVVEARASFEVP
jgi:hypothetical protein